MTIEQFIEDALTDYAEFENGDLVTIQVDPLKFGSGIEIEFTPGNVNLTLPNGDIIATPLAGTTLTLPTIGPVLVTAQQDAIGLQKPS